jgi:hypothetical protein
MTQPPPPASGRPAPYVTERAAFGTGPGHSRIGFVFAIIAGVLGLLQQSVGVFLPRILADFAYSGMQMSLVFGVVTFVHTILSVFALVFGVLGAQQRRSLLRAGIAIGVGVIGVAGGVIGLVVVPLVGFAL